MLHQTARYASKAAMNTAPTVSTIAPTTTNATAASASKIASRIRVGNESRFVGAVLGGLWRRAFDQRGEIIRAPKRVSTMPAAMVGERPYAAHELCETVQNATICIILHADID